MDRYYESLVLDTINSRKDITKDKTLSYDDIKLLSFSIDSEGAMIFRWHGTVRISTYKDMMFDIYYSYNSGAWIFCQKSVEPNYSLCETCIDDMQE